MSVTARRHLSALITALHQRQAVEGHDRTHPLVRLVCCDRWACLDCDRTVAKDCDGKYVHIARLPWISWTYACSEPAA